MNSSEALYCSAGITVLEGPNLEANGWTQRTVSDPSRIGELEAMYIELGFETTTAPLDPASFTEACTSCALDACPNSLALFTRKGR